MLPLDKGKDTILGIRLVVETEYVIFNHHVDGWLTGGNHLHCLDEFNQGHCHLRIMRPLAPPRKIPHVAAECRLDLILLQQHSVSSG